MGWLPVPRRSIVIAAMTRYVTIYARSLTNARGITMKAKTLTRNLQRTLSVVGKGYTFDMRTYRISHRKHLANNEVRYACKNGLMFVIDGTYAYIQ